MKLKDQKILLFDGVCNLCNGVVQFVLSKDRSQVLTFASLQSNFGATTIESQSMNKDDLKTFIYLRNGFTYTKSNAFLLLMRDLGGIYRVFEICWVIPKLIRDLVYDLVARNRYSMFGKRDECYLPTPELEHRFIS